MPVRIFISHHAKDEDFAKAVVDLLRAAFSLNREDIRCTSLAPYALYPGARIVDVLQADLRDAAVVIGLLTQSSIRRSWVLFELGYAWADDKGIGLLAGDVEPAQIPGPLAHQHAIIGASRPGMWRLLEQVREMVGLAAPDGIEVDEAMGAYLRAVSAFNRCLAEEGGWADARILPDRQTIFNSSVDLLKNHDGTIDKVEIYAPTGVWESSYPDKRRWFQALAVCLGNYQREPVRWPASEMVSDDIKGIETRLRQLVAIFGMPARDLEDFPARMANVSTALGLFHGMPTAYIHRAAVDTSTIPGIGYIRIDDTVAAAWAVRGRFGVDTAMVVSDAAIGRPVASWFDRMERRIGPPMSIQDLSNGSKVCFVKGMNKILKEFDLPVMSDCTEDHC